MSFADPKWISVQLRNRELNSLPNQPAHPGKKQQVSGVSKGHQNHFLNKPATTCIDPQ
jgi:hypothetical protein